MTKNTRTSSSSSKKQNDLLDDLQAPVDDLEEEDAEITSVDNKIFFYCSVSRKSCLALLKIINTITAKNLQIAHNMSIPIPPIYLYINSEGGAIQPALGVADSIKKSIVPITSIINGSCASAATCISVSCQNRKMTKHSTVMIHQLSNYYMEHTKQSNKSIKDDLKNTNLLSQLMTSIYLENTKMSESEIKKALRNDILWSADECLQKGFIDAIE